MELRNLPHWAVALAFALPLAACGDDSDGASSDEDGAMHTSGDGDGDTARESGDGDDDQDGHEGHVNDGDSGDPIEIEGEWASEFGDESIDSESWGMQMVIRYDNDDNVAITQNADDAEWSPGLFNRVVWTEPEDGAFFYCTVDFDLESAEDAEASTMTADDSDPDNSGCGGFNWTKLEAL